MVRRNKWRASLIASAIILVAIMVLTEASITVGNVIVACLGIIIIAAILYLVFATIDYRVHKESCNICKEDSGIFRKVLHDGVVCRSCMDLIPSKIKSSVKFTFVADVMGILEQAPAYQKKMEREAILASMTEEEAKVARMEETQQKIREIDKTYNAHASNTPKCPKCGSTSITANKKGFSTGKAIVGAAVTASSAGLAAGALGRNKVINTCMNCGKQWKPGKA